MDQIAAIDFFVVPTATFRVLYVFFVLSHDRRRVLHFNATANPSAAWTAQQIREAFPFDSARRYLIRDRDGIYGEVFRERIKSLGIEEVVTAPRTPWQNGKLERWHESLKVECVRPACPEDVDEARRLVARYVTHYNTVRLHSALGYVTPEAKLAGLEKMIFAERDRKLEEARARRAAKRKVA